MPRTPVKAPRPGSSAPLYPKLRPRPHGLRKEEVERNQRSRLFGAMVESVAVRGYAATSVAELSRLAGVSKRTFYEQFANKEACFLATYDGVVDCAIERVVAARRSEPDWEMGLRRALEAFVRAAVDQPKAARLALIEAPGAGPAALARMDGARRTVERMVAAGLDEAPHGLGLPPVVVKGIVCGIERVVRRSLLEDSAQDLPALAGELADWALSYGSSAVLELPFAAPTRRYRAWTSWSRVRVRTGGERARILRAAAEIAAGEGYARLTPIQIARRAGVSEQVFRACYESAEECFLDALDLVGVEALTYVEVASRVAGDGAEGAYRGIEALMDQMAEDPVLRGLVLVESVVAGAAAVERRERLLGRFAALLADRLPRSPQPPDVVAEAIVGALWGIVHYHVVRGEAHLLPELAGQVAFVALAPVVGAEAAVRAILIEECAALDAGGVGSIAA
jgi:AcrR family transcriptional regulator